MEGYIMKDAKRFLLASLLVLILQPFLFWQQSCLFSMEEETMPVVEQMTSERGGQLDSWIEEDIYLLFILPEDVAEANRLIEEMSMASAECDLIVAEAQAIKPGFIRVPKKLTKLKDFGQRILPKDDSEIEELSTKISAKLAERLVAARDEMNSKCSSMYDSIFAKGKPTLRRQKIIAILAIISWPFIQQNQTINMISSMAISSGALSLSENYSVYKRGKKSEIIQNDEASIILQRMGLPNCKIIPIQEVLDDTGPGEAIAGYGAIYLDRKLLEGNNTIDNITKFVLGHELQHVKDHALFIDVIMGISSSILINRILPSSFILNSVKPLAGCAGSYILYIIIARFYEWHADVKSSQKLGLETTLGGIKRFKRLQSKNIKVRKMFIACDFWSSEFKEEHPALVLAMRGFYSRLYSWLYTEQGNSRLDIMHPAVSTSIEYLTKIAEKQSAELEQKPESELTQEEETALREFNALKECTIMEQFDFDAGGIQEDVVSEQNRFLNRLKTAIKTKTCGVIVISLGVVGALYLGDKL